MLMSADGPKVIHCCILYAGGVSIWGVMCLYQGPTGGWRDDDDVSLWYKGYPLLFYNMLEKMLLKLPP